MFFFERTFQTVLNGVSGASAPWVQSRVSRTRSCCCARCLPSMRHTREEATRA